MNYWATRTAGRGWITSLKGIPLINEIAGRALSLRAGDELYLARQIRRWGVTSVLDIACGGGKAILGRLPYCVGVDIPGAPFDVAKSKGYDETQTYAAPDYEFSVAQPVDAITCINLNAHISPTVLEQILTKARAHLKPTGVLIMCNEYDNDGMSYRWMKKTDKNMWDRFVAGMQHDFLEYEDAFLSRIETVGFSMVERRALIGGLVPALHAYWFLRRSDPKSRFELGGLLAVDVPLSVINTLQCSFGAGINRAFQVGHVFRPI